MNIPLCHIYNNNVRFVQETPRPNINCNITSDTEAWRTQHVRTNG